jgi:hypothetical protein
MKLTHALVLAAAAFAGGACSKSDTAVIPGQPERKLTLTQPAKVTLERGGMAKTDVKIKRQALTGDVTVRFDKLPKGVEVIDAGQKIPGDGAAFTLKAGDEADLVANYVAKITAEGPDGITVSEPLEITVIEKKRN